MNNYSALVQKRRENCVKKHILHLFTILCQKMRYFFILDCTKCDTIVSNYFDKSKKGKHMNDIIISESEAMKSARTECVRFFRLASRSCVLLDRKIAYYALWVSASPPFECAIEVQFGTDHIRRRLKVGFAEGYSFYRLISRNGVTPCTLDDIIIDFYENKRLNTQ